MRSLTLRDVAFPRAPFTPLALSPRLWLDASDSATITVATGVSQWNDKSGNGFNFVQATGGNQPAYTAGGQNGLNCVTFTGASAHRLTCTGAIVTARPMTYVVVAKSTTTTGRVLVCCAAIVYHHVSKVGIFNGTQVTHSSNWTGSNADIVTAIFNGASSKIGLNQTAYETVDAGTTVFNSTNVLGANDSGGSFPMTGTICEVVVLAGAISDPDRTTLEAYLKDKWNTP